MAPLVSLPAIWRLVALRARLNEGARLCRWAIQKIHTKYSIRPLMTGASYLATSTTASSAVEASKGEPLRSIIPAGQKPELPGILPAKPKPLPQTIRSASAEGSRIRMVARTRELCRIKLNLPLLVHLSGSATVCTAAPCWQSLAEEALIW